MPIETRDILVVGGGQGGFGELRLGAAGAGINYAHTGSAATFAKFASFSREFFDGAAEDVV